MHIFLPQTLHFASLQKAFINPQSCVEYFYDGWTHFFELQNLGPIHCLYKAWKSQDIFLFNSDCIRDARYTGTGKIPVYIISNSTLS